MSFLSAMVSFLVQEAPHAAEDLKTLDSLTKQIRDLISKHPTNTREGAAALVALETVAQQGFQFLAAHSSMVAAAPKPTAKK